MIALSKLDNTKVLVCLETIKYIESAPDTLLFFLNGDSMIVLEPLDEVARRVVEFKRRILTSTD